MLQPVKCFTAVAVGVAAVLILCSCASGRPARDGALAEFETIARKYGLEDVRVAPPDVQPLVIQTPKDLGRIMRQFVHSGSETRASRTNMVSSTESDFLPTSTLIEDMYEVHRWIKYSNIFPCYFNLWANVWVAGSGSFWEITDVYEWVDLTGMTLCYSLSRSYSYHRISSDRQSAYIVGGGTIDWYFIFRGVLKVYSDDVRLSHTFRI